MKGIGTKLFAGIILIMIFFLLKNTDVIYTGKIVLENYTGKTQQTLSNDSEIKILSWNIENFGKSKIENATIVKIITEIVSDYDITAIQEVSNLFEKEDENCSRNSEACKSNAMCGKIKNTLLSSLGEKYDIRLSDYIKDERYLFIYNKEKVSLIETYLAVDTEEKGELCSPTETGLMMRQPFVAKFKIKNETITLMQVHTSPKNNIAELNALREFYEAEIKKNIKVILLGDLNMDCEYFKETESTGLERYNVAIQDEADTTVSKTDCAYDRFILNFNYSDSGVIYFDKEKNISNPESISDHYPIYLEINS